MAEAQPPQTSTPPRPAPPAMKREVAANVRETLRRLGPTGPLAIAAATLPPLGGFALLAFRNPLGEWLHGHQLAGWFLYVAGFALLAGLALLPTYAQAVLGGWAFGVAAGLPAALLGFVGAAALGYGVARWFSGDRVVRIIEEKPKWRAVYDALLRSGRWRTLLIVTLVRLPPNSPFAMTNLILSATRVPLSLYLLGTAIGMAPRTAVAVTVASGLKTLDFKELQHPWLLVAGAVVTIAVLGVIGLIANRAIARVTQSPVDGTPASEGPRA